MGNTILFKGLDTFLWEDIETFFIRSQYNEMLNFVLDEYDKQYTPPAPAAEKKPARPSFLNAGRCLTIERCVPPKPPPPPVGKAAEKGENKVAPTAALASPTSRICNYDEPYWCNMPVFIYDRECSLSKDDKKVSLPDGPNGEKRTLDFKFDTNSLTVGAVIWLYFYERMGIFKILGALLDDYNYRGKYTISGTQTNAYSKLINQITTLHRAGISSNLRDRICLYQRVLGVSIENNLGIESERNTGFMETFNLLIDYMLEYYRTKQLAQAIQAQAGTIAPRSSVATQTSIRDTINVLQQHFEPLQYGRNLINTFIGIATVHATLCLLNMLKSEIGIPTQHEKPEEFIPAAYDILVAKRTPAVSTANRFIIYDNCASYGYSLLTDIEAIEFNNLTLTSSGSNLDTWLNDIEGLVEGYRNAYRAVTEKASTAIAG